MIQLLVSRKVDLNASDDRSRTPLLMAMGQNNREIAELLLKRGADPNQKGLARGRGTRQSGTTDWGISTPLQFAIALQDVELARLVLEHKADVAITNENGYTPLHAAVNWRDKAMVELLLAHKADPNAVAKDGQTPLTLARQRKAGLMPVPLGTPGGVPSASNATTGAQDEKVLDEIAELLVRYGADEYRQRRSAISVSRASWNFSRVVFQKSNDAPYNRFTLFEVIARSHAGLPPMIPKELWFPDFARVTINRLEGKETRTIPLDLEVAFSAGDCSKDLWLEWGDVVEIPEAEHKLNEPWLGLNAPVTQTLAACLTLKVTLVVKGQTHTLKLKGFQDRWVRPWILGSGLLTTAADINQVKVTRTAPQTGEKSVLRFDLESPLIKSGAADLWLRDGDVIEIPEKE